MDSGAAGLPREASRASSKLAPRSKSLSLHPVVDAERDDAVLAFLKPCAATGEPTERASVESEAREHKTSSVFRGSLLPWLPNLEYAGSTRLQVGSLQTASASVANKVLGSSSVLSVNPVRRAHFERVHQGEMQIVTGASGVRSNSLRLPYHCRDSAVYQKCVAAKVFDRDEPSAMLETQIDSAHV